MPNSSKLVLWSGLCICIGFGIGIAVEYRNSKELLESYFKLSHILLARMGSEEMRDFVNYGKKIKLSPNDKALLAEFDVWYPES